MSNANRTRPAGPDHSQPVRIGIVAPARGIDRSMADRVTALAALRYGSRADLAFHPQCFLSKGHFGGSDRERTEAFLAMANDPDLDAIWFARGGYGSVRLDDDLVTRLSDAARTKTYLGYSDIGTLMAALYRHGIGRVVHGPMPVDITRADGDAAVVRALDYLVLGASDGLEPSIRRGMKQVAFNLTILTHLMGTPAAPDLTGHVVMIEEVAEYMYRIDRMLAQVTSQDGMLRAAGLMLGRWSDIPDNDPDFGQTAEDVIGYWCARRGIPYLGQADIGHDSANKIVPFGDGALA